MCACETPVRLANPRVKSCGRCGKNIPERAADDITSIPRDVFRERAWTMAAARALFDPSEFIESAERRAVRLCGEYVDNPMHIRRGMDRVQESRDEALDWRNHVVFLLEERDADGTLTDEHIRDAQIVLRLIGEAYVRMAQLDD